MGSNPQKPLQNGREWAISSQIAKIIKLRYYQNYWTDFNQILYNYKDDQVHIVGGPAHAYNKSKMADDRHVENIKFLIISQPCNRPKRNFAGTCRLPLQTVRIVKIRIFAKFKMADGRHIGNWKFSISLQPFKRSQGNFYTNMQIGAANNGES